MVTLTHVASATAGAAGVTLGLLVLVLVAAAPWLARHAQDGLPRPAHAAPSRGEAPATPACRGR
ncbi:hypothetical protein [Pseudonocardia spirodelae]|uniref:Uncharacterized protein n=1 Tax=Pseudonocardia spirodelae TaxID=3133431 RepID=A0ABU8T5Y8_9PSEU